MAQPTMSEWALKYGTANSADLHSGYTPLDLLFPSLGASTQSFVDVPLLESIQRERLKQFTSSELARLDCLPTRELRPGNLANGILPIYQRQNWEVTPPQPDFTRDSLYPLEDGNGLWIATNDAVWAIMQPSLQMASRMVMSLHLLPWVSFWILLPVRCTDIFSSMPCSSDQDMKFPNTGSLKKINSTTMETR
jgi:hypothetical protein